MATSPSTFEDSRSGPSSAVADEGLVGSLFAQFREHPLTTPVEMVSFWLAIALPFLYLPLLVAGVTTDGELLSVFVLVGANVLALVVGHGYRRDARAE